MTIFYKKVGRRYVPVSEYNAELTASYPTGASLIIIKPGSSFRTYAIEPAFAPMIAAGEYAKDAMSNIIMAATDLRPSKTPITDEQRTAWQALTKAFGEEVHLLQWPSAREAVDAGINAMQAEADKMLKNPAVKNAYDQFMLVYKLTKESNDA